MESNKPAFLKRVGALLRDTARNEHWYTDRTYNLYDSIDYDIYKNEVVVDYGPEAPYGATLAEREDWMLQALTSKQADIQLLVEDFILKSVEEWNARPDKRY